MTAIMVGAMYRKKMSQGFEYQDIVLPKKMEKHN
jgi:hypothetical protein